jgi:hypothetical protein
MEEIFKNFFHFFYKKDLTGGRQYDIMARGKRSTCREFSIIPHAALFVNSKFAQIFTTLDPKIVLYKQKNF